MRSNISIPSHARTLERRVKVSVMDHVIRSQSVKKDVVAISTCDHEIPGMCHTALGRSQFHDRIMT